MSARQLDTVIVWFRRDLRVYDNPALVAALNSARNVIPLYIWSPEEEGQFQPGRQTRWWCKHSVLCLGQRLQQLGSRLVLRRARESVQGLKQIIQETGAQAVFFNHLYDSISMVRDQQVKDELRQNGILVSSFNADLLYEPWEVLDEDQQPYTTFKSYWDRCLAMPYAPPMPLPEPSGPLPAVPANVSSISVQELDWFFTREQEASTEALAHRWDPAGAAAVQRLEQFLDEGLPAFAHDRAKTDRESTTMLSPWIHFGSISVRHIYYRVAQKHTEWQAAGQDKGHSCLDFLQQMGYREYSRYLAFHFPFITERSMLAHLRAVPWRLDQAAFKAWRMRQLWSMGWCHNRVRVVASHFMVKHLLLPWQWGLKHLWDCQIDADLECDALGWQYVSGCLSDAHPFNYLLNLEEEWRRFDPDGNYVRRWLPVLSQLPNEFIHQPWKAPPEVLEEAGVELGFNYPWPIISPEAAKEGVALAAAVVERCATSSGNSGSSTGTACNSLLPHKEPYRPPTDPALMSSFLAASREGSCTWQEKLPPLYIHSATGHPLSLHHSAQRRPVWGPSMVAHQAVLRRGRMGQQQLLLGGEGLRVRTGTGGFYSPTEGSQSPSASCSANAGSGISYSQTADSSSAAPMEDVSSSGLQEVDSDNDDMGPAAGSGGTRKRIKAVPGGRGMGPAGLGAGHPAECDSGLLVVPSISEEQQVVPFSNAEHGKDGSSSRRWRHQQQQYHRPNQAQLYMLREDVAAAKAAQGYGCEGEDVAMLEDDADDYASDLNEYDEDVGDDVTDSFGIMGMGMARPAASLNTACSQFKGPAGAGRMAAGDRGADSEAASGGGVQEQAAGALAAPMAGPDGNRMLVAEAARLQQLQMG
eukprot:gene12492-12626_t